VFETGAPSRAGFNIAQWVTNHGDKVKRDLRQNAFPATLAETILKLHPKWPKSKPLSAYLGWANSKDGVELDDEASKKIDAGYGIEEFVKNPTLDDATLHQVDRFLAADGPAASRRGRWGHPDKYSQVADAITDKLLSEPETQLAKSLETVLAVLGGTLGTYEVAVPQGEEPWEHALVAIWKRAKGRKALLDQQGRLRAFVALAMGERAVKGRLDVRAYSESVSKPLQRFYHELFQVVRDRQHTPAVQDLEKHIKQWEVSSKENWIRFLTHHVRGSTSNVLLGKLGDAATYCSRYSARLSWETHGYYLVALMALVVVALYWWFW